MSKQTASKEIFTILGEAKMVEGEKRFIPNSPKYFRSCVQDLPLGKQIAVTFTAKIPSRSQGQLKYHFVLLKYLSVYTGYTVEELHDAVMRLKFGTKRITLGNKVVDVRQSISDKALLPKSDAVELIEYDLQLCRDMKVRVPTAEELGYISNDRPYNKPMPSLKS